ncbi:MAG: hypothetical protein HC893_05080 [Chloroflexaceae bacterium]|nr:hypothetical protein [Chloroflexaceae bacterium]
METFPTRSQLWSGVVLSTIAHAIWVFADPTLSYEKSWDGKNYSVQNSMGARGTITFSDEKVVGVFFDENSPRNPFRLRSKYNLLDFFRGSHSELLDLAQNETLQYLLGEYNGELIPLITSAFWNEGEFLTAAEPWSDVILHGAHLIRTETLNTSDALTILQGDYEFSLPQVNLVQSLFDRKMKESHSATFVSSKELEILNADGNEGIIESCNLLAAIGIYLS